MDHLLSQLPPKIAPCENLSTPDLPPFWVALEGKFLEGRELGGEAPAEHWATDLNQFDTLSPNLRIDGDDVSGERHKSRDKCSAGASHSQTLRPVKKTPQTHSHPTFALHIM